MTVFKTFLKVLNKCKGTIIMYTIILVAFGIFNMKTSDNQTNFVASKPDILIINNDVEEGITKNLIEYMKKNSEIIEVADNEEARNDALFYRDVNYIIYIPENFREDFLNQKNPKIEIKSTGDYQASLAEMMLERYIRIANTYTSTLNSEEEIISSINETLEKETKTELTSKLDTDNLSKMAFYYNFANYSMLAGCVYVICIILSSFKSEMIRKRTTISSMNYKKYNIQLLLSNSLFAFVLALVYAGLSFILIGDTMFTLNGLFSIINLFVLTLCALTIAFLIGNLLSNKEAINGIVNVVALGSSFLCGSFVPMEWLPDSILKIAHILPSYYYVKNNEILKEMEVFNLETLEPILMNMVIMIAFSLVFILITNVITKKKLKKS
jgi:ABC-2 type transport system permease protein